MAEGVVGVCWLRKLKLTLGNCGLSRATVARAARGAAVGMPAAGAGLHATRETRNGSRRAKTVVGLKNFILLSKKALGMEAVRYKFFRYKTVCEFESVVCSRIPSVNVFV